MSITEVRFYERVQWVGTLKRWPEKMGVETQKLPNTVHSLQLSETHMFHIETNLPHSLQGSHD